jgi:imidazole glycerol-phosphate synthase subunit HisF
MRSRIIPILLLQGNGLYKTRKFSKPVYIGDPVNAIKIFNEKEVDELCFLDINASKLGKQPDFKILKDIASECFMPLSYGGGVSSFETVRKLTAIGFEKVIINSAAYKNKKLIPELSKYFGVSTIVGSMDVRKNWYGKEEVRIQSGTKKIPFSPEEWAMQLESQGAGEIIINSIDNDGEMCGYDIDLIKRISSKVSVPVIAAGGARNLADIEDAMRIGGASAAAAGAMFVFHGKHRAVLIKYPSEQERLETKTSQ